MWICSFSCPYQACIYKSSFICHFWYLDNDSSGHLLKSQNLIILVWQRYLIPCVTMWSMVPVRIVFPYVWQRGNPLQMCMYLYVHVCTVAGPHPYLNTQVCNCLPYNLPPFQNFPIHTCICTHSQIHTLTETKRVIHTLAMYLFSYWYNIYPWHDLLE